jgi:sugar phosphate isomerase/epimerase
LRIDPDGALHLTYCTNIHAADGWPAVFAALRQVAPALKERFSPDAPFGVGLRLSARDARELIAAGVDTLRAFLDDRGLYVAIINGFPHGSFHRSVVKANVYAPDWRDPERVRYTRDLIDILSALVPEGVDGGVSTVPLSYKAWLGAGTADDWQQIVGNVSDVAASLVRQREARGNVIHLDIEPEPDCVLETTAETISFFRDRLLTLGTPHLAAALGVDRTRARDLLQEHVRVCFDCCHFSVEHEDPVSALRAISAAGCRIGRIQLSSALDVEMPSAEAARRAVVGRLRPFADSTYLHQVVCRQDGTLARFADLDQALDRAAAGAWRIHFHVPLFTADYDGLGSTQHDVRRVIAEAIASGVTRHLEIETYTWDVLPPRLKIDLIESIAREYEWVLAQVSGMRHGVHPR